MENGHSRSRLDCKKKNRCTNATALSARAQAQSPRPPDDVAGLGPRDLPVAGPDDAPAEEPDDEPEGAGDPLDFARDDFEDLDFCFLAMIVEPLHQPLDGPPADEAHS